MRDSSRLIGVSLMLRVGEHWQIKTLREAWLLIEAMAEISQQFGFRDSNPTRRVNEVEKLFIQQQLSELTSFVRQLAVGNVHQAKVCGICTNMGHPTDSCLILQENGAEQVNMARGVPTPRRQYDPYSNTYNLGWRDYPNFSYGNRPQSSFLNRPPGFQQPWLEKTKKVEKEKEILDVFRKVQVNIPLLDAIKQVPKYAKFLKDLCINKRKLRGDERVTVGENVSAIFQRKLPPKCGDSGMFTIPCKIGHSNIENAMLDLGVSINPMPKSIYDSLNLGPLKETGIIIQLADPTFAYPDGIVENVLVQVDGLIFPVDFYVLYMDDRSASNSSPIILGRPFLSTAQTKIDVS
ncbi:uncharacterized protein [Coffea arabica]|uniref:Uncharacterized protein n=1 Tax=Coffea arabica TaxID=13443 RepID=A0A6P6SA48_COFAR|nr:uncharacterized protein LOC113689072 [Coffea arabica]